jgi:phosphohistidine phosphatase
VNLFLLRHAEAADAAESGKDFDRRLTEEGRKAAKMSASALSELAKIARIYTSPLVRARETAELAGREFPKAPLELTRALAPSAAVEEIVEIVAALAAAGRDEDVLLVGHQPHLGMLLGYLVSGRNDVEIPMKKAAVCCVSFRGGRPEPPGKLRWLLPPGVAEKIR